MTSNSEVSKKNGRQKIPEIKETEECRTVTDQSITLYIASFEVRSPHKTLVPLIIRQKKNNIQMKEMDR